MKTEKTTDITISRSRYKELVDAERKLNMLEAMGVDNWEGYDEAMGNEDDDEDDDPYGDNQRE